MNAATIILGVLVFTATAGLVMAWYYIPQLTSGGPTERLRRIPYFAALSDKQLARVAGLCRLERVAAGGYLVRESKRGDALYLVVEGTVNILKRGALDETLVQTVQAGDFIGEMALLTGQRRVASAQATVASTVLVIERDAFDQFLVTAPEIAQAIWNACDEHTIDLLLRDVAALREMSLPDRKSWIAGRASGPAFAGELRVIRADSYVAVIAGCVRVGEREMHAPALVALPPGASVTVLEPSRLAVLSAAGERPLLLGHSA